MDDYTFYHIKKFKVTQAEHAVLQFCNFRLGFDSARNVIRSETLMMPEIAVYMNPVLYGFCEPNIQRWIFGGHFLKMAPSIFLKMAP